MEKLNQRVIPVQQFHKNIVQSKNDHDLIQTLTDYISSIGGFGNAPKDVYTRLHR